eukprot:592995-Rhodomonas_salina.2
MATESYLMTASDFSRDKDLQYAVSKHTTTIKQQPTTFGAACVRISLARDLCCEKKLRSLSVVCETCVAQNRATLVPSCTSMCVGACYETGSNNNDIIIAEGTYKGITNSNNCTVYPGTRVPGYRVPGVPGDHPVGTKFMRPRSRIRVPGNPGTRVCIPVYTGPGTRNEVSGCDDRDLGPGQ